MARSAIGFAPRFNQIVGAESGENIIATFTGIRNVGADKIFDRTTQAAVDMSVALGTDILNLLVKADASGAVKEFQKLGKM